jgi:hypothetical protein
MSVFRHAWSRCKACGMWVREVRTTEEREDTPPENERDLLFEFQRRIGRIRIDEHRINPEELEICKRRGHDALSTGQGWAPCRACGIWLRETRSIEEREHKPRRGQLDPSLS